MGKESHQSTIELNGQQYNARTGKLIDGIRPSKPTGIVSDIRRSAVPHPIKPSKQVHKSAQPSKTLMRKAVQKPSAVSVKAVAMDMVQPQASNQTTAETFHHVSPQRVKRAEHVQQNSLISRFGDFTTPAKAHVSPLSETIAPATVPVHTPVQSQTLQTMPVVMPKHSKTNKVLEKGLRSAESHLSISTKKTRLHHRIGRKVGLSARAASIGAGSLAVLVLGAFFAYQNVPNINVRYAATKSGVRASLPGYQPSGFAVNNHVQYSAGKLTISYRANADSRKYNVTQQNTSWDSEALKDHLASTGGVPPQTYPSNGRTIYLHGSSSADWVAGGVWYSISGDAKLNTDQLIKIASSI